MMESRLSVFAAALAMCCLLNVSGLARAEFKDDLEPTYACPADDVLAVVRQEAALPGGEALSKLLETPVFAWSGRCLINVDNAYSDDATRFLILRLTVVNRGDAPVEFARDAVKLRAAGEEFESGKFPPRFRLPFMPLNGPRRPGAVPDRIAVPPGQAITFWTQFAGINKQVAVPNMRLELTSVTGQRIELDVNAQQNARLGLEKLAIGPGSALPVFVIHGELNTINSTAIASAVQDIVAAEQDRLVVTFSENAKPVTSDLLAWLINAGSGEIANNILFERLPLLPALRQVSLANAPEDDEEDDYGFYFDDENLFRTPEEAVTATLGPVLKQLPPTALLDELRKGHAWSKLAVLEVCGDRLGTGAWSILAEMSRSEDVRTRRLALAGLAHQDLPQAREILEQALYSSDAESSEAALRGILSRETPESRGDAQRALDSGRLVIPSVKLVRVFSEYYHPQWNELLVRTVFSPDAETRTAALNVLRRVGHPQLGELCLKALEDPEESVREAAFQGLTESRDRRFEQASIQYVLERLGRKQTTPVELRLLRDTRTSTAAPLLMELIDQDGLAEQRVELIRTLGEIGNLDQVRWLVRRLAGWDADTQAEVLQLAQRLPLEEQMDLAREFARSEEVSLRQASLQMLLASGSPEAIELIAGMLNSEQPDEMRSACMALAEIGSPPAIAALRKFRDKVFETNREAAFRPIEEALRAWLSSQPGVSYVAQGQYTVLQESPESERIAEKYYEMAIEVNPQLAPAYAARGNLYLRQQKFDKAGVDYAKAVELDSFDSQAVTGLAIVQAIEGKWEQALDDVLAKKRFYADDPTYLYNAACVMGRAIEYLEKQPTSPEIMQKIGNLQVQAIDHLDKSIEEGFDDFSWMKEDPDLRPLRELPDFKRLARE